MNSNQPAGHLEQSQTGLQLFCSSEQGKILRYVVTKIRKIILKWIYMILFAAGRVSRKNFTGVIAELNEIQQQWNNFLKKELSSEDQLIWELLGKRRNGYPERGKIRRSGVCLRWKNLYLYLMNLLDTGSQKNLLLAWEAWFSFGNEGNK